MYGVIKVMQRNFKDDLKASHEDASLAIWERAYRKLFVNYSSMADNLTDGLGQRCGVDRVIILTNSKTVKVDEKLIDGDYEKFFIEFKSSVEHNTPGWVEKELLCDYILYVFKKSGKCFLLPVPQLQRAYVKNKNKWHKQYVTFMQPNKGYTTAGLLVPIKVVMQEIAYSHCAKVEVE